MKKLLFCVFVLLVGCNTGTRGDYMPWHNDRYLNVYMRGANAGHAVGIACPCSGSNDVYLGKLLRVEHLQNSTAVSIGDVSSQDAVSIYQHLYPDERPFFVDGMFNTGR